MLNAVGVRRIGHKYVLPRRVQIYKIFPQQGTGSSWLEEENGPKDRDLRRQGLED